MATIILVKTIFLLCVGYFLPVFAEKISIKEDQTGTLSCPSGRYLDISYASYSGDAFFCKNNDVTIVVKGRCQWKHKCMIRATDTLFDDTCIGPDETLEIIYECKDDCFYNELGHIFYNGTRSITESGIVCQRWDSERPHIPKLWPEGEGHENYCRNPDDDDKPWCYTTDSRVRWEFCDIEECESSELPLTTTIVPLPRDNDKPQSDAPVAVILGTLFGILVTSIVLVVVLLILKRRGYCKSDQPEVGHRMYVYTAPEHNNTLMGRVRKMVRWRTKGDSGSNVLASNPGYSAMNGERIDSIDYANTPIVQSRVYEMPHATGSDDPQKTVYTSLYDVPNEKATSTDTLTDDCDSHDYEHPEAPKICTPKPKAVIKPILKKPTPSPKPSPKPLKHGDDIIITDIKPKYNVQDVVSEQSNNKGRDFKELKDKPRSPLENRTDKNNTKEDVLDKTKSKYVTSGTAQNSAFQTDKGQTEEPTYSEKSFMLDKLKQSNSVSNLVNKFNKS